MAVCGIALGGNVGDSEAAFRTVLGHLATSDQRVLAVSSFHETAPMGSSAGDRFLNATALVESPCTPAEFMQLLHRLEDLLGRRRTIHWGPRTIDLDLLFYEDIVIDTEQLVVPHPSLWYRSFVLTPLDEIASGWMHPLLGETVSQMFAGILRRPVILALHQDCAVPLSPETLSELIHEFGSGSLRFVDARTVECVGSEVFAVVDFVEPDKDDKSRTQPRHTSGRTICLSVGNEHDVRTGLADVCRAILG